MKAILLANRDGMELHPLTKTNCLALLPIATKPLIEYTFDSLWMAGIRQLLIVRTAYATELERHLQNGQRWGMRITYMLSHDSESPAATLSRLNEQLTDNEYLLVRADILQHIHLKNFLIQARQYSEQVIATLNGYHTGIGLIRRLVGDNPWQLSELFAWDMQLFQQPLVPQESFSSPLAMIPGNQVPIHLLEVNGNISLLDSLNSYHQTNLAVATGQFPNLIIPLRQVTDTLRLGSHSQVAKYHTGFIGAHCHVHAQASLAPDVILCDQVIVDSHAELSATVVLSNTYIGRYLKLHNAIVWGNLLIQLDRKKIEQVADNLVIADLTKHNLTTLLSNGFNRIFAILLLLVSLPLWPLALLAALVQNPLAPLRTITLRGNLTYMNEDGEIHLRNFITWEWQTSIPLLRHLPKLLAVISGHLYLIGIKPLTPEQARVLPATPWERIRATAPSGMIGPYQLTTPMANEERLLQEAYYAQTRCFSKDLFWLWRGLVAIFTVKAWWQAR
jgi:hypothetical protein